MTQEIGGTHLLLATTFFSEYPAEAARILESHPLEDAMAAIALCAPHASVAVLDRLNPDVGAEVLSRLQPEAAKLLLHGMDAVAAAALLGHMDPEPRRRALDAQAPGRRRELRELLTHAPDTAGALMDPRVSHFRGDETASEALEQIRHHGERRVTDLCVVDEDRRLVATVALQELAIADADARLSGLVRGAVVKVPSTARREEVVDLLETTRVSSLPVVDFEGRLLGVIRYDSLMAAAQLDATESLQAMVGAGRDERALSSPGLAIRKRLPWLQINLATAFLAAAVVGLFEGTIARFTALAVLLPVVAGQSGNTGAQALAVTMRGLALREIRIGSWFRVARKELLVCFVNGVAVALTTSVVVYLWTGSPGIPLVLAVSMIVSMVMAGLAGALIPVVLTLLGQDPAQSASIVLTTVTDVVGFLSFLGFATLAADLLGVPL